MDIQPDANQSLPFINVDFFEDLTGNIVTPEKKGQTEIGERIRLIRQEKNISLQDLSTLTGFDVETLEGIESNALKPQIGSILKLSKALDSAFGNIVSGEGDQPYCITRKNEQQPIIRSTSKKGAKQIYTYKSLASAVKGRHMEPLVVQLEEAPEESLSVHNGEEFIFVIQGEVSLQIGEEQYNLEPGDSAYYLSTTPHLISSKKDKATILAVIYES